MPRRNGGNSLGALWRLGGFFSALGGKSTGYQRRSVRASDGEKNLSEGLVRRDERVRGPGFFERKDFIDHGLDDPSREPGRDGSAED